MVTYPSPVPKMKRTGGAGRHASFKALLRCVVQVGLRSLQSGDGLGGRVVERHGDLVVVADAVREDARVVVHVPGSDLDAQRHARALPLEVLGAGTHVVAVVRSDAHAGASEGVGERGDGVRDARGVVVRGDGKIKKYPKTFFFFVQIQSSNELVVVVYVCEV